MSADDISVVQKFRDAIRREDADGAVALLVPDVEFVQPGRTMHGTDEVREKYVDRMSGSGPENMDVEFDPGELEDLGGGRVAATNHQVFRWKESGELAYERRARIEYWVRDGKIVRYEATILDG